jgi:diguanylate cyclase (GGDEF)-like protein/PAS domain S-box-containing protein
MFIERQDARSACRLCLIAVDAGTASSYSVRDTPERQTMKRITVLICAACALAVAAHWLPPAELRGPLSVLCVGLVAASLLWQQRAVGAALCSLRRERDDAESRYRALGEACSEPVLLYELCNEGRPGALVEANEAACMALGYPQSRLVQMGVEELVAPEARGGLEERLATLGMVESLVFETALLSGTGQRLPVQLSVRRIELGEGLRCLVVARDVAAAKQLDELLRGAAHCDELTGLLNRYGFHAAVWQARHRARRHSARVCVLRADLVGLRAVNARLGHAAGDALLQASADVLRAGIRKGDVLARLGGHEFVALAVLGFDDEERLDRETIVARFAEALEAKRAELGAEHPLALRYGSLLVEWEELGDIDELLTRADELVRSGAGERSKAEYPALLPVSCD